MSDISHIDRVIRGYVHPGAVLWRTIELETIKDLVGDRRLVEPMLDLGCGEGIVGLALFGQGCRVVGLEYDRESMMAARNLGAYGSVVGGDGRDLPFRPESMGTIVSNCVIEHIREAEDVLESVSQTLRPGGCFLFTVPTREFGDLLFFSTVFRKCGFKGGAELYSRVRNERLNHYHCYAPDEWQRRLASHGLDVIAYRKYMSHKLTMLWDIMSVLVYVLTRAHAWSIVEWLMLNSRRADGVRVRVMNRWIQGVIRRLDKSAGEGGGLAILSIKKGGTNIA